MRGCATHWNACRRRAQWKTTKSYCHGIAHLKYTARFTAHLWLGGVYGALTNYLAEIIKRTLAKLGIDTELAFNLEFNHTGSTENHPLHIHGALCIPEDRVKAVSEALRKALAMDYRQRYTNLAASIKQKITHCSF